MIREYALEPELVASWHELIVGRFFIDQFGSGTGRVVSRYPRKWRRLVWDAFEAAFGGGAGDIERKRIEELLAQLVVPEVRRPNCIWDETKDWLANTETEHARKPFFAILARENPRTNVAVICASDVLRGTPPRGQRQTRSSWHGLRMRCLPPLPRCWPAQRKSCSLIPTFGPSNPSSTDHSRRFSSYLRSQSLTFRSNYIRLTAKKRLLGIRFVENAKSIYLALYLRA